MSATTEPEISRAYGEGKTAGERFRGVYGPARGAARGRLDDLASMFADLTVDQARGRPTPATRVDEVRRAAVRSRLGDWSGLSVGVVATLATQFDDSLSRGWLPVMLAEQGRFEEAVEHLEAMPGTGAPGWPRVKLVTALWELGRHDEARELMRRLQAEHEEVGERSLSVWDDGPAAAEFARLRGCADTTAVPTFLHLPFSGGTSMIVALKNVLPWRRVVEIQRRFGLLQVEAALGMGAEEAGRLLMVHLHHALPLELPGREASYFTVLRDPVSQIRSGFFKRQSTRGIVPTGDSKRSKELADHVEHTTTHGLTNMLARQIVMTHPDLRAAYHDEFTSRGAFRPITAEEDMFWFRATADLPAETLLRLSRETLDERFHLVGTMRHLAASHLAAAASTGVPVADRVGHRGRSGQPSDDVGDAVHDRLREANWVDQQLFDDYTARFETDHAGLIEAVAAGTAVEAPSPHPA